MKTKFIALFASLFLALPLCNASAGPEDVAALLEAKNASYKTLAGSFEHVKTTANKKSTTMSGKCTYVAPGSMALIYDNPEGDKMIITPAKMLVVKAGKETTYDLAKTPSVRTLSSAVTDAVAGRVAKLAADCKMDYTIETEADGYLVTLTAKKKAPKGYSRIVLKYRKSDCMVTRIEMEEFNHTLNVYAMKSMKANAAVDPITL